MRAELRGEDAVERCRGPAALEMPENDGADLTAESPGDLAGDHFPHAPEPHLSALPVVAGVDRRPPREPRPLRDDDERVALPFRLARGHRPANVVEVPVDLGEKDDVAPAGDAGMEGDPAGMPPHHFKHHHALVAGGGGVEPIEGVGGGRHGRIEAEGERRGAEIVVDRLRDADDRNTMLVALLGDRQRAIAADAHQPADPQLLECRRRRREELRIDRHAVVLPHQRREPAAVGGADDRPPQGEDVCHDRRIERRPGDRIDEPLVAAEESDGLVPEAVATLHHRPDDGIQPRAIPATGEDSDARSAGGHDGDTPETAGTTDEGTECSFSREGASADPGCRNERGGTIQGRHARSAIRSSAKPASQR